MLELKFFKHITRDFPRHPLQLNKTNESDAEIIKISDGGNYFAFTVDNIVEEIEFGIYKDPYLIGWMSVIINITDLLAVGAKPLFILLSETFPKTCNQEYITNVQKGIKDACEYCNIFVLGGDTNYSSVATFGATAMGEIQDQVCQRKGCKDGDVIFTSGKLGAGNFHALLTFFEKQSDFKFMPKPYTEYYKLVSRYATSCIDTSDGLINSIATIKEINNCGVMLYEDVLERALTSDMIDYCDFYNINPWLLLGGVLGEYELIYTVSKKNMNSLLSELESLSLPIIPLGKITKKSAIEVLKHDITIPINYEAICELNQIDSFKNISDYIKKLSFILKNL